jgi:putative Holliday junction resolvase
VDSPNIHEYLGVDMGNSRVGIARGASPARLAQPLKTIAADDAIGELLDLAKASNASAIVIGLPRSLDGGETDQTKAVRQWADQLKKQIGLPLFWQDEALTSRQAETQPQKADGPGTDAQAAAIILQDFLDSPEDDRVAV